LLTIGASTTKDAVALSGVEWGTSVLTGRLGGVVVDILGVVDWFGSVGACAGSSAPSLCESVCAPNVGDPLATPLPLPFPLPSPAPLPLPVLCLPIGCCRGRDTSSDCCGLGGCSFVGVGSRAACAVGSGS
jgi:hypothetical protein